MIRVRASLMVVLAAGLTAACQDSPVVSGDSASALPGHALPQYATSIDVQAIEGLRRFGIIRFLAEEDLGAWGMKPAALQEIPGRTNPASGGAPRLSVEPDDCETQVEPGPECPQQEPDYSYGAYAAPISYGSGNWRSTTLTAWSSGGDWSQYVMVFSSYLAGGGCTGSPTYYGGFGAGSYVGGGGQTWDYPAWNTSGSMTFAVSAEHHFGRGSWAEHIHYSYAAVCG